MSGTEVLLAQAARSATRTAAQSRRDRPRIPPPLWRCERCGVYLRPLPAEGFRASRCDGRRITMVLPTAMNDRPLVRNDPAALDFRVNRAAMVDPAILELERGRIFDVCWIYAGHESEVRAPGDFKTRTVCGRPVIFCRDGKNAIRVFLNT